MRYLTAIILISIIISNNTSQFDANYIMANVEIIGSINANIVNNVINVTSGCNILCVYSKYIVYIVNQNLSEPSVVNIGRLEDSINQVLISNGKVVIIGNKKIYFCGREIKSIANIYNITKAATDGEFIYTDVNNGVYKRNESVVAVYDNDMKIIRFVNYLERDHKNDLSSWNKCTFKSFDNKIVIYCSDIPYFYLINNKMTVECHAKSEVVINNYNKNKLTKGMIKTVIRDVVIVNNICYYIYVDKEMVIMHDVNQCKSKEIIVNVDEDETIIGFTSINDVIIMVTEGSRGVLVKKVSWAV